MKILLLNFLLLTNLFAFPIAENFTFLSSISGIMLTVFIFLFFSILKFFFKNKKLTASFIFIISFIYIFDFNRYFKIFQNFDLIDEDYLQKKSDSYVYFKKNKQIQLIYEDNFDKIVPKLSDNEFKHLINNKNFKPLNILINKNKMPDFFSIKFNKNLYDVNDIEKIYKLSKKKNIILSSFTPEISKDLSYRIFKKYNKKINYHYINIKKNKNYNIEDNLLLSSHKLNDILTNDNKDFELININNEVLAKRVGSLYDSRYLSLEDLLFLKDKDIKKIFNKKNKTFILFSYYDNFYEDYLKILNKLNIKNIKFLKGGLEEYFQEHFYYITKKYPNYDKIISTSEFHKLFVGDKENIVLIDTTDKGLFYKNKKFQLFNIINIPYNKLSRTKINSIIKKMPNNKRYLGLSFNEETASTSTHIGQKITDSKKVWLGIFRNVSSFSPEYVYRNILNNDLNNDSSFRTYFNIQYTIADYFNYIFNIFGVFTIILIGFLIRFFTIPLQKNIFSLIYKKTKINLKINFSLLLLILILLLSFFFFEYFFNNFLILSNFNFFDDSYYSFNSKFNNYVIYLCCLIIFIQLLLIYEFNNKNLIILSLLTGLLYYLINDLPLYILLYILGIELCGLFYNIFYIKKHNKKIDDKCFVLIDDIKYLNKVSNKSKNLSIMNTKINGFLIRNNFINKEIIKYDKIHNLIKDLNLNYPIIIRSSRIEEDNDNELTGKFKSLISHNKKDFNDKLIEVLDSMNGFNKEILIQEFIKFNSVGNISSFSNENPMEIVNIIDNRDNLITEGEKTPNIIDYTLRKNLFNKNKYIKLLLKAEKELKSHLIIEYGIKNNKLIPLQYKKINLEETINNFYNFNLNKIKKNQTFFNFLDKKTFNSLTNKPSPFLASILNKNKNIEIIFGKICIRRNKIFDLDNLEVLTLENWYEKIIEHFNYEHFLETKTIYNVNLKNLNDKEIINIINERIEIIMKLIYPLTQSTVINKKINLNIDNIKKFNNDIKNNNTNFFYLGINDLEVSSKRFNEIYDDNKFSKFIKDYLITDEKLIKEDKYIYLKNYLNKHNAMEISVIRKLLLELNNRFKFNNEEIFLLKYNELNDKHKKLIINERNLLIKEYESLNLNELFNKKYFKNINKRTLDKKWIYGSNFKGNIVLIKDIEKDFMKIKELDSNDILIMEYLPSNYIHNINNIRGIITKHGNELSHSSVIRNVKKINYLILENLNLNEFKNGSHIDTIDLI